MNAQSLAQRAYSASSMPTRTSRSNEYSVIADVTRRLRDTARTARSDYPGFVQALSDNRRLWTALAADVSAGGNALPEDLRARIFFLAEFTEAQSRKVLRHGASVAPLLEINTAILRGLGQNGRKP
ncbi:flagellar protein FlaF [Roseivivax lentus]|uniref:Flagellar protein FlaF n=1 Tax=Roseivivax lentus TaxID=633194 RepID=A0A1N7JKS5_9RHOB|nr:flagellar biosynthesis regulator FlaF [Roseivivax lentus]SIS49973.1 flagellar protein FlaF [Roseivivax lentus]